MHTLRHEACSQWYAASLAKSVLKKITFEHLLVVQYAWGGTVSSAPFLSFVYLLIGKNIILKGVVKRVLLRSQRRESWFGAHRVVWTVLPFKPKYQLGHPENYLFHYLKKICSGSKYPKKHVIKFWKRKRCVWMLCTLSVSTKRKQQIGLMYIAY